MGQKAPYLNIPAARRKLRGYLGIVASLGLALTLAACGGGGGGAPAGTSSPAANTSYFTVNPVTGNAPLTVTVTSCVQGASASTTGGTINWGDNSTMTIVFNASGCLANVTQHLYAQAGTYSVQASVPSLNWSSGNTPVTVSAPTATANNQAPSLGQISLTPQSAAINDTVQASASASDPDTGNTVLCIIDWGDGTVRTNQTCSAVNTHQYTQNGTYTVRMTPVDNLGLNGNAQTATVTVSGAPANAPAAPVLTTQNIPGISGSVNATSVTVSGNKGNNCTSLFSSHQSQAIVSTNSTTWSYTFQLNQEGDNIYTLFCRNAAGQSSAGTTLTLRRKTVKPIDPIVDPAPNTVSQQVALTGQKPLDCDLWIQVPGSTASMVDNMDSYTAQNKNTLVGWNQTVTLNNTGSQTINIWCQDDVTPTALRSNTVSVTVNNTTGGGTNTGGGNTNNANSPLGAPNCTSTGFSASCSWSCSLNGATSGTGVLYWVGSDSNGVSSFNISSCGSGSTSLTYQSAGTYTPYIVWTGNSGAIPNTSTGNQLTIGSGQSSGVYIYSTRWDTLGYNIAAGANNVIAVSSSNNCLYEYPVGGGANSTCITPSGLPRTPVRFRDACFIGTTGRIALLDAGDSRVYILNSSYAYVSEFQDTNMGTGASGIGCSLQQFNGNYLIGVAVTGQGKGYLFAENGGALRTINAQGAVDYVIDSNGNSYIVGTTGSVSKVDLSGQSQAFSLTTSLNFPTSLAIDDQDRLFFAEAGAASIRITDPTGATLNTLGDPGQGAGKFGTVSSVAVYGNRVYANDASQAIPQISLFQ